MVVHSIQIQSLLRVIYLSFYSMNDIDCDSLVIIVERWMSGVSLGARI
jgi:hypothetical protein